MASRDGRSASSGQTISTAGEILLQSSEGWYQNGNGMTSFLKKWIGYEMDLLSGLFGRNMARPLRAWFWKQRGCTYVTDHLYHQSLFIVTDRRDLIWEVKLQQTCSVTTRDQKLSPSKYPSDLSAPIHDPH